MLRVMPALEAYVTANIATQNLFGGSPFQFLLGDLNSTSGTGALSQLMGPQPGVLTLAEMVKGEYNIGTANNAIAGPTSGTGGSTYGPTGTMFGTPIEVVTDNFKNNFGNIIVGSIGTTIGFRLANKVLAKPKRKFNAMLKQVGLGSTVQM